MPNAVHIYSIATQQLSESRWIAFDYEDAADCAHADNEFAAICALVRRWQAEAAMDAQR